MKKKDFDQLKNKNIKDLEKYIAEGQKSLVMGKLELKMGKVKNVHLANQLKKDIAKAQTILTIKRYMKER